MPANRDLGAVSLKQQIWTGVNRLVQANGLGVRFTKLENVYPTSDGQTFRRWPGFRCVADLVTSQATTGYSRTYTEAVRPLGALTTENPSAASDAGTYERIDPTETKTCKTDPTHILGFEFVNRRLILWGESDFRKENVRTTLGGDIKVKSWTVPSGGGAITLTLGSTPATSGFNSVQVGDIIYVDELDTSDPTASDINEKFHEVSALSGSPITEVTITTTSSASSTLTHSGGIYRTRRNQSGTYPVSYFGESDADTIQDEESLTTYQVESDPKVGDPATACFPAQVANRMMDQGDIINILNEGTDHNPRRKTRSLTFKPNPDISSNRLLLAAERYGCVFQVPMITPPDSVYSEAGGEGINEGYNDVWDMPRCLGVPKAVLLDAQEDSSKYGGNDNFIVNSAETMTVPDGTYKFRISWRDDATGEVGVWSEPIEVELSASRSPSTLENAVNLFILHPGYLMAESLSLTLMIWATEADGDTFGFWKALQHNMGNSVPQSFKYGFSPASTPSMIIPISLKGTALAGSNTEDFHPDELDFTVPPPLFTQMPMGCTVARTIRGITLFSGYQGTHGRSRNLQRGEISSTYRKSGTVDPFRDKISTRTFDDTDGTVLDDPFNLANPGIGPAYAGQSLFALDAFPWPTNTVILDSLHNLEGLINSGVYWKPWAYFPRWKLLQPWVLEDERRDSSVFPGGPVGSPPTNNLATTSREAFIRLPQGSYQWSELDNPGITPPLNVDFLDAELEKDVVAIGRWQGGAVFCTRSQTHVLRWNQTPNGQRPIPILSTVGCIGTNTMVEYDGGLAWMSERGPVALHYGSFRWVAEELEDYFVSQLPRYTRDGDGMMRHAWSAHDPQRGLVMWGMVSVGSTVSVSYKGSSHTRETSDDSALSRFPADEVLVWSYRADIVTTWRPPAGLEIHWMRHGICEDGVYRMLFLANDKRIYALDEFFAEHNSNFSTTASAKGESSTSLTIAGTANGSDARGIDDNLVIAGMLVQIYDQTTKKLKVETTVASIATSPQIITLSAAGSWESGDLVIIGAPQDATIEAQFVALKPKPYEPTSVKGVYLRHSVRSSTDGSPSWATCQLVNSKGKTLKMHGGGNLALLLGEANASTPITAVRNFDQAVSRATDHQLKMVIKGPAQTRIHDIYMEFGSD